MQIAEVLAVISSQKLRSKAKTSFLYKKRTFIEETIYQQIKLTTVIHVCSTHSLPISLVLIQIKIITFE